MDQAPPPPPSLGRKRTLCGIQCILPQKKSTKTRCTSARREGGSTQASRCHRVDETRLLAISVRPLCDIFGNSHFHFSSRPLTIWRTLSQFFPMWVSSPRKTPRYLSPPFFHTRPPGSLSRSPSFSPTIRASLFPQFTFAEEIKPKLFTVSDKISMSFCVFTRTIRSSAYTDNLKDTLHWGKHTPFKTSLSLWSRGSMAREYNIPERESSPASPPSWC